MSDNKASVKGLKAENENLMSKINILEQSLKGALKENTVLRVDINVLQSQLKDQDKLSKVEKNASVDVLETQLKYKLQECEDLSKKLDEAKKIQMEMEKQLQSKAKDEKRIKELEAQVKSLTKVVDSQQQKAGEESMKDKVSVLATTKAELKEQANAPIKKSAKKKSTKA